MLKLQHSGPEIAWCHKVVDTRTRYRLGKPGQKPDETVEGALKWEDGTSLSKFEALDWLNAINMPISTRRQAQTRPQGQRNDLPGIESQTENMAPQEVSGDAPIDHMMEYEEQGVEEDEEVLGMIIVLLQMVLLLANDSER